MANGFLSFAGVLPLDSAVALEDRLREAVVIQTLSPSQSDRRREFEIFSKKALDTFLHHLSEATYERPVDKH